MTPNGTQEIKVQRTLLDLDSFEDVTLVKVGEFKPVQSADELMTRIGNDSAKFLKIVNDGLRSNEQQALKDNESVTWRVVGDDGKPGDTYNGTPADPSVINPLVLNIAKAATGYLQAKDAEGRKAAKDAAIEMIKSSPVMLESIKKQALAASKDVE